MRRPRSTCIATEPRRSLTTNERRLAETVFGDCIDYAPVTINRRRWWPFQGVHTAMAPDGHLWFNPQSKLWCNDFSCQSLELQGLFIHEMTHVWQHQQGIYLPLARHPFCRYSYVIKPGRPFRRYGIEQQAEIVRHAFLLREGVRVPGAPDAKVYESLLPFRSQAQHSSSC